MLSPSKRLCRCWSLYSLGELEKGAAEEQEDGITFNQWPWDKRGLWSCCGLPHGLSSAWGTACDAEAELMFNCTCGLSPKVI